MQITALNHVAIHVADLAASKRFYGQVLGLCEMGRPDFNFPGAWFSLGERQELHLIAKSPEDSEAYSIPRERHFALSIADVGEAVTRLGEAGVEFSGPKPRPDGVQQIFLRDPDGHVIELADA